MYIFHYDITAGHSYNKIDVKITDTGSTFTFSVSTAIKCQAGVCNDTHKINFKIKFSTSGGWVGMAFR